MVAYHAMNTVSHIKNIGNSPVRRKVNGVLNFALKAQQKTIGMDARISIVAIMCFAALAAVSSVKVTETELEFPTYGFSDPDPVPRTESPLYPYFRFDGSANTPSPRRWKAVILENEKIRVTMLPEIGGKVWGAEDKTTGRAFVYWNHVVKFRNIALRGPWCSGGIEFNFGITGHAPTSATPVDWYVRKNDDGSASFFAGATEYVNRTTWQVEVRLEPGADCFSSRVVWFNGSGVEVPLYHWMNAAFPLTDDTEFLFPGRNSLGHAGDASAWPVDREGRNLSVYAENAFGENKSYHVVNGDNRMFGIWWPEHGLGAIHRNPQHAKFGRKIWLWSQARSGAIWENLLTDGDGQYAELQSGRAFQQPRLPCDRTPFKIPGFAPGVTESYEETWGVARSRADFGTPETGIRPRPVEMPKDFDWNSAQGLCAQGVQKLRERTDMEDGERLLKSALGADPNYAPALDALASLAFRRARYEDAAAFAERSLALDTYDGTANLVAGLAAFARGDLPTAKERLSAATFAPELRPEAYARLAVIALREGDWNGAIRLADLSLGANGASMDALLARAVAMRKAGRGGEALAFARATLGRLPLFHAMRYELGKAGGGGDFRQLVRGEFPHETCMDMAAWYAEAGLCDEARELLAAAGEHPIARLSLAFMARDASALDGVAAIPTSFAFPFRRETLPALEWAARTNGCWKFKYYLALFKAANGDADGADALLDACADEPDDPAFYLYRAGRKIGARRLADISKAERYGGGWRAGLMRCREEHGEKALAAARRLHAAYPRVNQVKLAYAKALLEAKRYAECVKFLEGCTILPSEFGENAMDVWRAACHALGENGKAESWPERLGAGKPYPRDVRPYEFRRAGRTKDDVPPLVDFEDGNPWRMSATDAGATCEIVQTEQLFGTNTLRLSYCGKGSKPGVTISPGAPVPLPEAFDTFYVWVKGNHWGRGANTDFSVPATRLSAVFRRRDGEVEKVALGAVDWPDWHQVNRRFSPEEVERLAGGSFVGFEIVGGCQPEYRHLHFDDVSVFKDSLERPLGVKPRAKRNIKPLEGAVTGINSGEETLPFPTREETIIPETASPAPGDLLPAFNGGAVDADAASCLKTTAWRSGKSLVVDFFAPAGTVREVTAGTASEAKVVKSFTVPYLAYGTGEGRLKIDLLEGGWYRSAVFDWYRSNASAAGSAGGAFTMRYFPKTDGTFNPVSERLVITLSRDFADVLPEIPNPTSPHRAVTGGNAWRPHASFDHAFDMAFWREVKRQGIDHVVINDHETLWRDRGESFTFRTDAAPMRGGDAAAAAYSRYLRIGLGYVYGPYNNYTDFSPMNAHWSRDMVARRRDGTFEPAWVRCYGPKPVLAPQMCEEIVPKAQVKFRYNTAYCDVHTTLPPWLRTDYDARVPGAATFAQTFYAWGELMLLQKKLWNGPVYSEGSHHFMYAGLVDGNYAQDRGYDFLSKPWIVDFDLLRIHPKECDFGMGTLSMFSPGKTPQEKRFYMPHAPTEKELDELLDLYLTATVAFGHAPFLVLDYCFDPPKPFGLAYGPKAKVDMDKGMPIALRSYAMVQPIAARYAQAAVRRIAYLGTDGRWHSSSAAIASGDVARNQILVEYEGGVFVVANGNTRERLKAVAGGRTCDLPPRAFWAWTEDGAVRAEIVDAAGRRSYFSTCPEFTWRGAGIEAARK